MNLSHLLNAQSGHNLVELCLPMVFLFWAFSANLMFCALGERLTSRYIRIDVEITNFIWYIFPLDVQKMLPILLNGTQDAIVLSGIGNVLCTHEAFKDVR